MTRKKKKSRTAPDLQEREANQPSESGEDTAAAKRRDSVEQIVIAIILALLFRAFEAEAFVIPTGSMAPTLMGRHKDIKCDKCHYPIRTGASEDRERGRHGLVEGATCPMCRYITPINPNRANHISFSGDRILVNKFAYQFGDPQRWDVIVFKYPGNPKQNYIKRLVGLPGETLGIKYGDVYVRDEESGEFRILRKPHRKLRRLLQVVHDTDYIPSELLSAGWPACWQDTSSRSELGEPVNGQGWSASDDQRTYTLEPTNQVSWLRYRHIPPRRDEWQGIERGEITTDPTRFRGQLITDFCTYNGFFAQVNRYQVGEYDMRTIGWHWVGDLALECDVEIQSDTGELELDLVEGGRHHTCRINVADGMARLSIDEGRVRFVAPGADEAQELNAQTKIRKPGSYRLRFANADDQLLLWVNNRLVSFSSAGVEHPGFYRVAPGEPPRWSRDDPADLHPLGVGGKDIAMEVRQLRVLRDIYYVATEGSTDNDYARSNRNLGYVEQVHDVFSRPELWAQTDLFASRRADVQFTLDDDQFFPMGDNSPQSKDARLWHGRENVYQGEEVLRQITVDPYVERKRLIGKAFLVYWPHAWQITRNFIPIVPNVKQMGRIR